MTLGVASSAVYVSSVTDLLSGAVLTFGPTDAVNLGSRRQRRQLQRGGIGAASAPDAAGATVSEVPGSDAGAGALRRLQSSGVSVAVAVRLASDSSTTTVDNAASLITGVAQSPALSASVFAPVAVALASATNMSSTSFVATVSASSIVISIPPGPVPPIVLSAGGAVGVFIALVVVAALTYAFVIKPRRASKRGLRLARVVPSCLAPSGGAEPVAPDWAVAPLPEVIAAASAGDVAAKAVLGHRLENVWQAAPLDAVTSAAEKGEAAAQSQLARRLMTGTGGCSKDVAAAALWLTRAAEQHVPHSEMLLGSLFLRGDGVAHNFDKGMAYMVRAAAHGDELAQEVVEAAQSRAPLPTAPDILPSQVPFWPPAPGDPGSRSP